MEKKGPETEARKGGMNGSDSAIERVKGPGARARFDRFLKAEAMTDAFPPCSESSSHFLDSLL